MIDLMEEKALIQKNFYFLVLLFWFYQQLIFFTIKTKILILNN